MTDARIACIRDADAVAALAAAFGVRARGDVPLLGDARWSEAHWHHLRATFAGLPTPRGAAWATFTSGSTGSPRVVLRSEASWVASFDPMTALIGLRPDDVVALPVSVISSMTVFQAAHARHVGAEILLPTRHTFDEADLRRATVVHTTPLLLADIVARLESMRNGGRRDAMRVAIVGGDALTPELRSRTEALGVRVVAYVGAAELSFVGVDPDGSGLRPFPGVDVRVDADDVLWARSPYVALGYADGAEGPLRIDHAGWATVGDRVRLDRTAADATRVTRDDAARASQAPAARASLDDAASATPDADAGGPRITMLGRADGAILTAGATVIPEDVEATLRGLPRIADAAVTGVTAPRVGTLVAAVIQPSAEGGPLDLPATRRAIDDLLPRSHRPRRWITVEALPRTLSGKLDRAAVARIASAGIAAAVTATTPATGEASAIGGRRA